MESLVHVQRSRSGGYQQWRFLPVAVSPLHTSGQGPLQAKPHCRSPRPYPLVRIMGGEDACERTRLGCTTFLVYLFHGSPNPSVALHVVLHLLRVLGPFKLTSRDGNLTLPD